MAMARSPVPRRPPASLVGAPPSSTPTAAKVQEVTNEVSGVDALDANSANSGANDDCARINAGTSNASAAGLGLGLRALSTEDKARIGHLIKVLAEERREKENFRQQLDAQATQLREAQQRCASLAVEREGTQEKEQALLARVSRSLSLLREYQQELYISRASQQMPVFANNAPCLPAEAVGRHSAARDTGIASNTDGGTAEQRGRSPLKGSEKDGAGQLPPLEAAQCYQERVVSTPAEEQHETRPHAEQVQGTPTGSAAISVEPSRLGRAEDAKPRSLTPRPPWPSSPPPSPSETECPRLGSPLTSLKPHMAKSEFAESPRLEGSPQELPSGRGTSPRQFTAIGVLEAPQLSLLRRYLNIQQGSSGNAPKNSLDNSDKTVGGTDPMLVVTPVVPKHVAPAAPLAAKTTASVQTSPRGRATAMASTAPMQHACKEQVTNHLCSSMLAARESDRNSHRGRQPSVQDRVQSHDMLPASTVAPRFLRRSRSPVSAFQLEARAQTTAAAVTAPEPLRRSWSPLPPPMLPTQLPPPQLPLPRSSLLQGPPAAIVAPVAFAEPTAKLRERQMVPVQPPPVPMALLRGIPASTSLQAADNTQCANPPDTTRSISEDMGFRNCRQPSTSPPPPAARLLLPRTSGSPALRSRSAASASSNHNCRFSAGAGAGDGTAGTVALGSTRPPLQTSSSAALCTSGDGGGGTWNGRTSWPFGLVLDGGHYADSSMFAVIDSLESAEQRQSAVPSSVATSTATLSSHNKNLAQLHRDLSRLEAWAYGSAVPRAVDQSSANAVSGPIGISEDSFSFFPATPRSDASVGGCRPSAPADVSFSTPPRRSRELDLTVERNRGAVPLQKDYCSHPRRTLTAAARHLQGSVDRGDLQQRHLLPSASVLCAVESPVTEPAIHAMRRRMAPSSAENSLEEIDDVLFLLQRAPVATE